MHHLDAYMPTNTRLPNRIETLKQAHRIYGRIGKKNVISVIETKSRPLDDVNVHPTATRVFTVRELLRMHVSGATPRSPAPSTASTAPTCCGLPACLRRGCTRPLPSTRITVRQTSV